MRFQAEQLTDELIAEMTPLTIEHDKETTQFDVRLNINWNVYKSLQENGLLFIATARDGENLVGYHFCIVSKHPHYADDFFAEQDALYVLPEYRGRTGVELLKYTEHELKRLGVSYILQHTKLTHNMTNYLERMGYEVCDILFSKRLKDG